MRKMEKPGELGYRQRPGEIVFDKRLADLIEKMGSKIEKALSGKNIDKITQRDKDQLEYAKMVILFRKNELPWEELEKKTRAMNKAIGKEETRALSLWVRGTRRHKNELLSSREMEELYERIDKRLKELKKAPSLCNK